MVVPRNNLHVEISTLGAVTNKNNIRGLKNYDEHWDFFVRYFQKLRAESYVRMFLFLGQGMNFNECRSCL